MAPNLQKHSQQPFSFCACPSDLLSTRNQSGLFKNMNHMSLPCLKTLSVLPKPLKQSFNLPMAHGALRAGSLLPSPASSRSLTVSFPLHLLCDVSLLFVILLASCPGKCMLAPSCHSGLGSGATSSLRIVVNVPIYIALFP